MAVVSYVLANGRTSHTTYGGSLIIVWPESTYGVAMNILGILLIIYLLYEQDTVYTGTTLSHYRIAHYGLVNWYTHYGTNVWRNDQTPVLTPGFMESWNGLHRILILFLAFLYDDSFRDFHFICFVFLKWVSSSLRL